MVIAGFLLSIVLFFLVSSKQPHWIMQIVLGVAAFVMSIAWMYLIANEVVSLMQAMGLLFGVDTGWLCVQMKHPHHLTPPPSPSPPPLHHLPLPSTISLSPSPSPSPLHHLPLPSTISLSPHISLYLHHLPLPSTISLSPPPHPLPTAILGLTVLAIGNSVGDWVADTAVARAGKPGMGVASCFGSPLLNDVLGLSISLLVICVCGCICVLCVGVLLKVMYTHIEISLMWDNIHD